MPIFKIDEFSYTESSIDITVEVFYDPDAFTQVYRTSVPSGSGPVSEEQRGYAEDEVFTSVIYNDFEISFAALLNDPYAYIASTEPVDPSVPELNLEVYVTNESFPGSNDGELTLVVNTVPDPVPVDLVYYSINGGTDWVSDDEMSYTFTGLSAGEYVCVATLDTDDPLNFYTVTIVSGLVPPPDPDVPSIYMSVYEQELCDDKGNITTCTIFRRVPEDTIPQPLKPLQWQGGEPITIEYPDSGEYKMNQVNGSSITLNLAAYEGFELSDLYANDEQEWWVILQGYYEHQGFIVPDNCYEPYASKPYPITIRCTDRIGMLKDVPYSDSSGKAYKGFESDIKIIANILLRTGLELDIDVAANTYEDTMNTSDSPIEQTFVNQAAFVDDKDIPLTCTEVLESILNRYSARLHQWNGRWQIVNVLEKSAGDVPLWSFNSIGEPDTTVPALGNSITVGEQYRSIIPTSANLSTAKGIASSMAYYKYGYPSTEIVNGDFDDWDVIDPLPDNWEIIGSMTVARIERLDEDGNPTGDYYPNITANTVPSSFLRNMAAVQIISGQKVQVSFVFDAPDAYSAIIGDSTNPWYLGVQVLDVTNTEYYTPNGWIGTANTYDIMYRSADFKNQLSVNFSIPDKGVDWDLKIGLRMVNRTTGDQADTAFNNLKISGVSTPQTQPAIGVFTLQTSKSFQTYRRGAIVLLHGDDFNTERTSQISIGSATVISPPTTWSRAGISETASLLQVVANSELRQHQRPYRMFEALYVVNGEERIDINTLLSIDRLDGSYIFMSGVFNLKSGNHRLKHAQAFTEAIGFNERSNISDYGAVDLSGGKESGETVG